MCVPPRPYAPPGCFGNTGVAAVGHTPLLHDREQQAADAGRGCSGNALGGAGGGAATPPPTPSIPFFLEGGRVFSLSFPILNPKLPLPQVGSILVVPEGTSYQGGGGCPPKYPHMSPPHVHHSRFLLRLGTIFLTVRRSEMFLLTRTVGAMGGSGTSEGLEWALVRVGGSGGATTGPAWASHPSRSWAPALIHVSSTCT